nr:hypothetical protein [Tanacetum cinerariifolium]
MHQDSYNSNSLGFDQPQPPQSPVIHQPPQELITPVLSTEEPGNSLSMEDEHLDTILATESDELIKSSVENLIPILSESEGIPDHMCDVPFHDNSPPLDVSKDQFEDFSESNDEFSLTDDDSFSFDNIDYVEASPPVSELVSSEIDAFLAVEDEPTSSQLPKSYLDPNGDILLLEAFLNDDHSFDFKTKSSSTSLNSLLEETNNFDNSLPEFTTFSNVLFDAKYESDSSDDQSCSDEDVLEKIVTKPLFEEEIIPMKSLHTHDSSLPISSNIDYLLDEFAGELTLLKLIPSRIDETDCDFEEDIRLIKKLLYDNSFPRLPEEFVSANSDTAIESFSPSPILVKDSDSLMEEIDLFCTPDYPMPQCRRALSTMIMTLKGIFSFLRTCLAIIPFHLLKKSHSILTFLCFLVLLQNHQMVIQEKSHDLLSHWGLKAFQHFATCPMMIHGQNNPILDVLLFHFYPP